MPEVVGSLCVARRHCVASSCWHQVGWSHNGSCCEWRMEQLAGCDGQCVVLLVCGCGVYNTTCSAPTTTSGGGVKKCVAQQDVSTWCGNRRVPVPAVRQCCKLQWWHVEVACWGGMPLNKGGVWRCASAVHAQ
jgi:hypothetical protein